MSINVIIPMYNEEERLSITVSAYAAFVEQNPDLNLFLYLVDDGSTDNTLYLANSLISQYKLNAKVFAYASNRGKGYAVKYGMLNSEPAEYYYLADADLSAPWFELKNLPQSIDRTEYSSVFGSRRADVTISRNFLRDRAGKSASKIIKLVLGITINDTQCGYKLFKKEALLAFNLQKLEGWGFDFEIAYILEKLGYKIKETTVAWRETKGSKVKLVDYLFTLYELARVRLSSY